MSWYWVLVSIVCHGVAPHKGTVNGECEILPVVENSYNNVTHSGPYKDGEIVAYTCNENFSTIDYPFYKCVGNAFVGNMSCTECKCNEPNTTDKHIIVHNKNCYIAIACSLGYTCHGQASLFCRPDGRLSPSQPPECKPVSCGAYGYVENGHITFESDTGNKTIFGSTGMIECNDGYLLDGDKYFTCQADGTWTAKGTCKPFNCPAFPGIQSRCVEKTYISANNYYVKCRDDIPTTDIGETTSPMQCLGSSWLKQSRSCFCHCYTSDLEKQIIIYGLEDVKYVPHSNVLRWTCANGAKENVVRDGQIQCFDGKFNSQPSCLVDLDENKHSDEDGHFLNKHTNGNGAGGIGVAIDAGIASVIACVCVALVVLTTIICVRSKKPFRDRGKEDVGMETRRDVRGRRLYRSVLYKAQRPFKVKKSSKRSTNPRSQFSREDCVLKSKEIEEIKCDASCQIQTSVAEQNQTAKPGHIEIAMDEKIKVFTDENGGQESNNARNNLSEQYCVIL